MRTSGIAVGKGGKIQVANGSFSNLSVDMPVSSLSLYGVSSYGQTQIAVGYAGTMLKKKNNNNNNNNNNDNKWEIIPTPISENLRTIVIPENNHVLAGTTDGIRYENTDISVPSNYWTYSLIEEGNNSLLRAATYDYSNNILYAVRGDGTIHRQINSATYSGSTNSGSVNAVAADGSGSAWAVGDKGSIYKITGNTITKSGDVIRPTEVTSVTKAPGGKYYAVTTGGHIGVSDDGDLWDFPSNAQTAQRLNAIHFFDDQIGVAVGNEVILRTTNGGSDWQPSATTTTAYLNDISFVDKNNAVLVGNDGTILLLHDNTLTPKSINVTENLNGVSFNGAVGFAAGNNGTLLRSEDSGNSWTKLMAGGQDWVSYTNPPAGPTADLNGITAIDQRTAYAVGNSGVVLHTTDGGDTWSRRESLTGSNQALSGISLSGSGTVVMSGPNGTLRSISSDSCRFSARFYYDKLGRLVASQNSKQRAMIPPRYSYTRYDKQGRIVEVGEIAPNPDRPLTQERIDDDADFPNGWSDNRFEVTLTQYDTPLPNLPTELEELFSGRQENLRNRVASVLYQSSYDKSMAQYSYATHYSYDIHGNVKELVQDNPDLKNLSNQQYKKLVYEYDLVSGNVNKVSYQPGNPDQFYHRYEYDADNRITKVHTSLDDLIWDNEASYQYYKHGPLARTEIGDLKVQGVDYAYTLQGWIKAVNGLDNDMGKDAVGNNFAKDAFGYSLHYNQSDYKAIGSDVSFLNKVTNSSFSTIGNDAKDPTAGADLYNGNIGKMVTAISDLPLLGKTYKYDELNRLVASETYEGDDLTTTNGMYDTKYKYDANGNILNLTRYSANGKMDELSYHYVKDGNGEMLNNRLLHVNDDVTNSNLLVDITDQGRDYAQNNPATQNYAYDKIGNLIKDEQEEIAEIKWNVQGKVQEIKRTVNSTKPDLLFKYDAMGNRVSKTVIYPNSIEGVKEVTTYYVRDAQGNVMAVYESKKKSNNNDELYLAEQHLYGSSRLGMRQVNTILAKTGEEINPDLTYSSRVLGEKNYELTNHLGNVLAVVSDKKLPDNLPDIVSASDYYPFGMGLPGRGSGEYRYGFNGQEKETEITNTDSHYSAEFWMYDGRLGRRWNIDPVRKPWQSNYATFSNNPIWKIDPNGDDDFFNCDGEFSHSTEEGNSIKIISDTDIRLITNFDYSSSNPDDISMMLKIQSYYASQIGIKQNITKVKSVKKFAGAAFYDPDEKTFGVCIDVNTDNLNYSFDDINNTKNTWYHEKRHQDDPSTKNPLKHVQVIIDQAEHETFENTTFSHKQSCFSYASMLLNEAMGIYSMDEVNETINNVNNSVLGSYGIFYYNEQTKKVDYVYALSGIEVISTDPE